MPRYPFVQAHFDYGFAYWRPRAFVVHMAEGGGTVGYLSRLPARGVSVHFVIEYSGRIVQMLRLNHVSGSLNPATIRTTDDPPFIGYNGEHVTFGATARKRVMGPFDRNPNHAVISVEVEGFALIGPNKEQRKAIVLLSHDVVTLEPTIVGMLGHRDWQDEKRCPGHGIPWAHMPFGHHGHFSVATK